MAKDPNTDAALEVSDQAEYIEYLKNAPIADFAKFAGIDIDEAVNRRIAAAVADAPPKMEVTARPVEPQGNLYGFASVKIGGVTVDDFKVLADKEGKLFVGMPSKPDKSSKTGYRSTVHVDKDLREDFTAAVLSAHYDAVETLMERAEKMRSGPEQPPRMADQVQAAAKEAAKHNTALPPKDLGGKKRDAAARE